MEKENLNQNNLILEGENFENEGENKKATIYRKANIS